MALALVRSCLGCLLGSSSSQAMPTVVADVHVERIMTEAIKGPEDLQALQAGRGPRVSHTSRLFVTLLN